MDGYRTLKGYGEQEIVIKKSRFISCAKPITEESEAVTFIQEIRKRFPDASHHCYAYIIGKNSGIMRYSDDGEPSGTAGIPMLEVLKMRQIVDAVVVVTRYFGGTLLGAGGLVRAYTQGCSEGINKAEVVMMEKSLTMTIQVPYFLWDKTQYEMGRQPVQVLETDYSEEVLATFLIREKDLSTFEKALTNWSEGKLTARPVKEGYQAWSVAEEPVNP
ncbi:MAG: YigZ family protein [Clostridiales bacterium]|nr:YigZ family protein [Clostridiales bacterium]